MQNTTNKTIESYQIMVNASEDDIKDFIDEDGYTEWGMPQRTKELAIECFKDELRTLYSCNRKLYKIYKARPVKIVRTISEIIEKQTTSNELVTI